MENVLFKISFPAEFHSQTAVEAAMTIHQELAKAGKTPDDIKRITIRTHEACIRIIDKKGPLDNPADRDHCIQYMVAVPILFGRLTAQDYEDEVAKDPRIDKLREKIVCVEDPQFTQDYHDPEKRSIANALTVEFSDGKKLKEIVGRVPHRPQAPAQGRHARARGEVQDQSRAALPGEAAQGHPGTVPRREAAGSDAGARVRRPDGDLSGGSRVRPPRGGARNRPARG